MRRILGFDENGFPNFIKATKLASIASAFVHTGQGTIYPYKRRARRNEGTMYILAYLLAADESLEEGLRKEPPINIEQFIKEKQAKSKKDPMVDLRLRVGAYSEKYDGLVKKYLGDLIKIISYSISRKYLEDTVFVDAFGGYGTFSLAASKIGLRGYYVELNPVVYFFFTTFIRGRPKDLDSYIKALLEYLEKECSKYRPKKENYLTIRARIGRCPVCHSHVPIVVESKKRTYVFNHVRRIDGRYRVKLYELDGRRSEIIYVGKNPSDSRRRCPKCNSIASNIVPKNIVVRLIDKDRDSDLYVDGFRLQELPRAYAIPIADGFKENEKVGHLENPYYEGVEKAKEELIENREKYKELIPYERLPKSIDEQSHGISEIEKYLSYWTQLMTPRQLICYAKIVEWVKRIEKERVKRRLTMLVAKSVQQNVLTYVEHRRRGIKHISPNQTINFFILPVEARIPGSKEGSIKNILTKRERVSIFGSIGEDYKVSLHDIKVDLVEHQRPPRKGELVALNLAVQNLKNLEDLRGTADVAFVDPPYVDMVPYFDLSYLYYVWMKKIYPDIPPLEEIRDLDLTTSDIRKFAEKLKEAFEGIAYILNNKGFGVLQFNPPRKDREKLIEMRAYVMAAIASAGMYPLIASSVFSETSKERGVSDLQNVKTVFVLFAKPDVAEEFLEKLTEIYEGEIEERRNVVEYIAYLLKAGRVNRFLERIFDPEYPKPIVPRLEEVLPLIAALTTSILKYIEPDLTLEEYYRYVKNIIKRAIEEISILSRRIIGVPKGFEKDASNDLTFVYAYALKAGIIDLTELSILGVKKDDYELILEDPKGSERIMSKLAKAPKPLTELYNKPNEIIGKARILYSVLMALRELREYNRSLNEAAEYLSKYATEYQKKAYEFLLGSLREYVKRVEGDERNLVNDAIRLLERAIRQITSRFLSLGVDRYHSILFPS